MPSYLEKVVKAIRAERNHLGSSRQAIAKYLKAEFDSDNKTVIGILGFVFWFAYGVRTSTPFFAKRVHKRAKTPKDKFVVTITVIIFLIYPTLCSQAFSIFRCQCDETRSHK